MKFVKEVKKLVDGKEVEKTVIIECEDENLFSLYKREGFKEAKTEKK